MGKKYYVSSTVGEDLNNGTDPTTPFASLQKAADVAQAGDVVSIMPGIYSNSNPREDVLTIRNSGTAGAPITFEAFDLNNKPAINVRNFTGVRVLGSYVTLDGLVITGNRAEVFEQAKGKDLDTYIKSLPGGRGNPTVGGFGIAIGSFFNNIYPNNVTVKNSIIRDSTAGGIAAVRADYVTIENNEIYRNAFYSSNADSGISFYQSRNSDRSTDAKMIVRGNVIYENKNLVKNFANFKESDLDSLDPNKQPRITDGNGIIIDDGARTQRQPVDGDNVGIPLEAYLGKTLIENNIVYNNGGQGISAFNSSNVEIRNNTVANNRQTKEIDFGGDINASVDLDGKQQGAGKNITIANNKITSSQNIPPIGVLDTDVSLILSGSSGRDNIVLNSLSNGQRFKLSEAYGKNGNDVLTGSNTTNVNNLFGDGGDDILNAGAASQYNYLVGGRGNDIINCDSAKAVTDTIGYSAGDGRDKVYNFVRGSNINDKIYFNEISNIDVVTKGNNTEFRIGDGISSNAGFGGGRLLMSTVDTIGFTAKDIDVYLFGSNFTFS